MEERGEGENWLYLVVALSIKKNMIEAHGKRPEWRIESARQNTPQQQQQHHQHKADWKKKTINTNDPRGLDEKEKRRNSCYRTNNSEPATYITYTDANIKQIALKLITMNNRRSTIQLITTPYLTVWFGSIVSDFSFKLCLNGVYRLDIYGYNHNNFRRSETQRARERE